MPLLNGLSPEVDRHVRAISLPALVPGRSLEARVAAAAVIGLAIGICLAGMSPQRAQELLHLFETVNPAPGEAEVTEVMFRLGASIMLGDLDDQIPE